MKLKLTYDTEEQEEADAVLSALRPLLTGAKVRYDKSRAPKQCVYWTTKKPANPCSTKEQP